MAILIFPVFFAFDFHLAVPGSRGAPSRRRLLPFIGYFGWDEAMVSSKRIGVTGATGFIGHHVVRECQKRGHEVVRLQRSGGLSQGGVRHYDLECLRTVTPELLAGIDAVIHLAALVHVPGAPPDRHQRLNYLATKTLFDMCEKIGVGSFVFTSSVSVYGVNAFPRPISLSDRPQPTSGYGIAKRRAEEYLLRRQSHVDVAVIRLPLVYGERAPGNFGLISRLAGMPIPLLFGGTKNRRSMISVEKAARLLVNMAEGRSGVKGIHIAAEKSPLSTADIIRRIRTEKGMSPLLFPLPGFLLRWCLTAIGRRQIYQQLYEDLEFEGSLPVE